MPVICFYFSVIHITEKRKKKKVDCEGKIKHIPIQISGVFCIIQWIIVGLIFLNVQLWSHKSLHCSLYLYVVFLRTSFLYVLNFTWAVVLLFFFFLFFFSFTSISCQLSALLIQDCSLWADSLGGSTTDILEPRTVSLGL